MSKTPFRTEGRGVFVIRAPKKWSIFLELLEIKRRPL